MERAPKPSTLSPSSAPNAVGHGDRLFRGSQLASFVEHIATYLVAALYPMSCPRLPSTSYSSGVLTASATVLPAIRQSHLPAKASSDSANEQAVGSSRTGTPRRHLTPCKKRAAR